MELNRKLAGLTKAPKWPPKVPIGELTNPAGYHIVNIQRVNTKKFGPCIMVEVELPEMMTAVTFLPSRFNKELSDVDLIHLRAGNYYIKCTGEENMSFNVDIFKKK